MLWIEPRAPCTLDKSSSTELHPQPIELKLDNSMYKDDLHKWFPCTEILPRRLETRLKMVNVRLPLCSLPSLFKLENRVDSPSANFTVPCFGVWIFSLAIWHADLQPGLKDGVSTLCQAPVLCAHTPVAAVWHTCSSGLASQGLKPLKSCNSDI